MHELWKNYLKKARRILNSIESKISEAVKNNEISHVDFMTLTNEEKIYRELKESIGMTKNQRIVYWKKKIWFKRVKNRHWYIY